MKFHLGLATIPELGDLPANERRSVWRRARRQHAPLLAVVRRCWPAALLGGSVIVVGYWFDHSSPWLLLVWAAIGGGIAAVVANQVVLKMVIPHLPDAKRASLAQQRSSEPV